MPKTEFLGLELTTDDTTVFKDWRESLNGENDGVDIELSNMQIIDNFASEVDEKLGDIETALDAILGV